MVHWIFKYPPKLLFSLPAYIIIATNMRYFIYISNQQQRAKQEKRGLLVAVFMSIMSALLDLLFQNSFNSFWVVIFGVQKFILRGIILLMCTFGGCILSYGVAVGSPYMLFGDRLCTAALILLATFERIWCRAGISWVSCVSCVLFFISIVIMSLYEIIVRILERNNPTQRTKHARRIFIFVFAFLFIQPYSLLKTCFPAIIVVVRILLLVIAVLLDDSLNLDCDKLITLIRQGSSLPWGLDIVQSKALRISLWIEVLMWMFF